MIALLTGNVLDVRLDSIVINVGGVGMQVLCAPDTVASARIGQDVTVHTSLVVREDSLTLFGFENADNRDLFDIIQGVSGFGPKLAFTVLATLPGDQLRSAIANEDIARLTKTPGVGTKGAARLVLELKDRIGTTVNSQQQETYWQDQVAQGLIGLGWSGKDAQRAIEQLTHETDTLEQSVPTLLRRALQILGTS